MNANYFTEAERAAIIARTKQATHDVLFSCQDAATEARGFNIALYAASFDFCGYEEKNHLFHALCAAWHWAQTH